MTTIRKGLHRGRRTGLRVAWEKGGKPKALNLVRLPFRDEAADLITSFWQRGAYLRRVSANSKPLLAGQTSSSFQRMMVRQATVSHDCCATLVRHQRTT